MTELNSTSYQLPGTYIAELLGTSSSTADTTVRCLCLMGKGSRYITQKNTEIVRGYISDETITFSLETSGDYMDDYGASLLHTSDANKQNSSLVETDSYGTQYTISTDYWDFNSSGTKVILSSHMYHSTSSYVISYQSTDYYVDIISSDLDLRKISAVGSSPSQNTFVRNTDYYIPYTITETSSSNGTNSATGVINIVGSQTNNYSQFPSVSDSSLLTYIDVSSYDSDCVGAVSISTAGAVSVTVNGATDTNNFGISATAKSNPTSAVTGSIYPKRSYPSALDSHTLTVKCVQVGTESLPFKFKYTSTGEYSGLLEILTADITSSGRLVFGDGIRCYFSTAPILGDTFVLSYTSAEKIDWSLNKISSEIFGSSSFSQDRNGYATGIQNTYYLTLAHDAYTNASSLTVNCTGTTKPTYGGKYSEHSSNLVSGTFYLIDPDILMYYSTDILTSSDLSSFGTITVTYLYSGDEPDIGSTYYLSGDYLRPDSYYNTPMLFSDEKTAESFVAPYTVDNELAIAINVAYSQVYTPQTIAICMIKDSDGDGKFTKNDVQNALTGCANVDYIKDFVPVGLGDEFTDIINSYNVKAHDAFEGREQFWYYGASDGTSIANLTNISTNKLAVSTTSLAGAHGSRIMVAPTYCKFQVTLDDGTTVTPRLDGSFVAVALAANINGQPNSSVTVLNNHITGFSFIQTYNKSENMTLGAANVIFFNDLGSEVYSVGEDCTTDNFANHYHEILAMREKQEVTRYVRSFCNTNLIGRVPDSVASGISMITDDIIKALKAKIADGTIPNYTTDDGTVTSPSSSDVSVYVDSTDDETYHMSYWFPTRSGIKKLYGVFATKKSDLTQS